MCSVVMEVNCAVNIVNYNKFARGGVVFYLNLAFTASEQYSARNFDIFKSNITVAHTVCNDEVAVYYKII